MCVRVNDPPCAACQDSECVYLSLYALWSPSSHMCPRLERKMHSLCSRKSMMQFRAREPMRECKTSNDSDPRATDRVASQDHTGFMCTLLWCEEELNVSTSSSRVLFRCPVSRPFSVHRCLVAAKKQNKKKNTFHCKPKAFRWQPPTCS